MRFSLFGTVKYKMFTICNSIFVILNCELIWSTLKN